MKKYILLFLLPIFLGGCEKDYNTIIDSNNVSYQVLETSSFDSFTFSPSDSLITVTLKVNSSSEIENIYFNIFSSDEKQLNNSPVELLDNGSSSNRDAAPNDNIFSNKFPLSQAYPIGLYTIKFYIKDILNNTQLAAEQNFNYNNGISYQVLETSSFKSFTYSPSDSSITVFLKVNSSSQIKNIYFDIFSSDEKRLNNSPVELLDNGVPSYGDAFANDNTFSNKFPLSQTYPIGLYTIKFYIKDISNTTKQVALQNFNYDNGQSNKAPMLSNVTAPDTVTVTSTSVIFMSVNAFDENGLSDIEKVYFTVTRPNGTTSGIKTDMFDDGDVNKHGDQQAGDGIYSVLVQVTSDNAKGTYKFDYQALDRGGKLSQIISHNIEIK